MRYKYLTRMASIIYQVEDLKVLDDIASTVSEFELEKEFDKAFTGKKQTDTKSMIMSGRSDLFIYLRIFLILGLTWIFGVLVMFTPDGSLIEKVEG